MDSQHQIKQENPEIVEDIELQPHDPANLKEPIPRELNQEEIAAHMKKGKQQCSICYRLTNRDLLIPFCCSEHIYCKGCIINMVQTGLNSFQPIKCPHQDCLVELSQKSPYFEQLKEDDLKKLVKIRKNRQVLQNPELKICRRQNCDGILKINSEKAECQQCKKKHCKKCFEVEHEGRCDLKMASLLSRKHGFKKCPNCKMVVQKNKGCDHITCYCSYEFCYICNTTYTRNHKCPRPKGQNCLQTMHLQLERDDSLYNKCLHCGNILNFLTPGPEHSKLSQYCMIIFFTIVIYPVLVVLFCSATVGALLFWLLIFLTAATIYFILYPLLEIFELKTSLSKYLLEKGLPTWAVRVLTVFLYPVHIVLLIIDEAKKLANFQLVPVTHFLPFFMTLPCLLVMNISEQQE